MERTLGAFLVRSNKHGMFWNHRDSFSVDGKPFHKKPIWWKKSLWIHYWAYSVLRMKLNIWGGKWNRRFILWTGCSNTSLHSWNVRAVIQTLVYSSVEIGRIWIGLYHFCSRKQVTPIDLFEMMPTQRWLTSPVVCQPPKPLLS